MPSKGRLPPVPESEPVIEHRCLYCQTPQTFTNKAVFLCDKCLAQWNEYKLIARWLLTQDNLRSGPPHTWFTRDELRILMFYDHYRAKIVINFWPYWLKLKDWEAWKERQDKRKPRGRPRQESAEWARQQKQQGQEYREILEEFKRKYNEETGLTHVDALDSLEKVLRTPPKEGK